MSTFFVSLACNTSSFDQNMVLIFARLKRKGTGQISSCFTFGCFCFGHPLRFWVAITCCFWKKSVFNILHISISGSAELQNNCWLIQKRDTDRAPKMFQ